MKDNTVRDSSEVMPELITSFVENIIENSDGLDLKSEIGINNAVWMIIDHYDIATEGQLKMNFDDVHAELMLQLGKK
ncbi:hypothetical protein [Acinetobacter sp.]|uniref:hypothetical protein n=1 Tax=Acinetobacter sp. TaxID=472 RepID=UPI0031CF6456